MQAYSQFDRNEADRTRQSFVDFNAPVVDVLQKVEVAHPDLASRLIPDRVHPGEGVHWVMAATILKAWHAPSLVSSVTVDAHEREGNRRAERQRDRRKAREEDR